MRLESLTYTVVDGAGVVLRTDLDCDDAYLVAEQLATELCQTVYLHSNDFSDNETVHPRKAP